MRIKWIKLLFRLVGLNFLSHEAGKWVHHFKEDLKGSLRYWMVRGILGVFMFILVKIAFIFGLVALGFYLNERFYSTYQGFLLVAGGCLGVTILLLVILQLFGFKRKRKSGSWNTPD